jgi:hypothetical protein
MTDPVALVEQLDADAIGERLEQLRAERNALLILKRAALARRRAPAHREVKPTPGDAKRGTS